MEGLNRAIKAEDHSGLLLDDLGSYPQVSRDGSLGCDIAGTYILGKCDADNIFDIRAQIAQLPSPAITTIEVNSGSLAP